MGFMSEVKTKVGQVGDAIKESFGPLAPLEANEENKSLRYPLDLGDTGQFPHTVQFICWKPAPQSVGDITNTVIDNVKLGGSKAAEFIDTGETTPPVAENSLAVNRNQKYNSRLFDFSRRVEGDPQIISLYIPQQGPQDKFSNSLDETSMTDALGKLGLYTEAGSSLIKAWKSGSLKDIDGGAFVELIGGGALGVGENLGLIGNKETLVDAALASQGFARNPQFEVLYKGSSMRNFTFQWDLIPRSQEEADMIRSIVTALKYHASPSYTRNEGRYIVPPSYIDVKFLYQGSETNKLFKISTCQINLIEVNYTPLGDTFTSFSDGSATATQIFLGLTELEMMHKSLRQQGY